LAAEILFVPPELEEDGRASMRPRPIGRGNEDLFPALTEAREASMRPRPIGRGNMRSTYRYANMDVVASMRPRPIGRGNGAGVSVPLLSQCASMRPRPIGRGNDYVIDGQTRTKGSFNEAAANWPRKLS